MVRKISLLLAAALSAAGLGACGADANPLIGKWHMSGETPIASMPGVHCTITDMVFTATSTTSYDPAANPPLNVTYLLSDKRAAVRSEGGDVIYFIIDANHIRRDDAFQCTYQRAG